ncbi:MAG TPA: hypothetical protein VGM63_23730 [Mucilaginibacter sp.]
MRKILYFIIIVTIPSSTHAQDFGKWTNGCYYDTTGKKTCGLIRWDIPALSVLKGDGDHIFFRDTIGGSRQKLRTDQLKAFVINGDSLVISRADDMAYFPVLWVVINNPLKLYIRLNQETDYIQRGVNKTYYFGPDPDIIVELTRSKFIEAMSSIVADDTKLVSAIKNKTYRYGDMDEVIEKYTAFRKTKNSTSKKQ